MKDINKAVGDLQLERYLLGELSRGERAWIRRRLQSDEVLRFRLRIPSPAALFARPQNDVSGRRGRRAKPGFFDQGSKRGAGENPLPLVAVAFRAQ